MCVWPHMTFTRSFFRKTMTVCKRCEANGKTWDIGVLVWRRGPTEHCCGLNGMLW